MGKVKSSPANYTEEQCFEMLNRIDSYPREKNQGVAFEAAIAPVDLIISLECSAGTMVERILQRAAKSVEKRADDNEETIKNRIATFVKNTDEILNQYPTQTRRVFFPRSFFRGIRSRLPNRIWMHFPLFSFSNTDWRPERHW